MIQQLLRVCIFGIVGFLATVLAYVVVATHPAGLLSPLSKARFSLADAPSQSLVGTITATSGTVLWLSRVATTPVGITGLHSVHQGEELQTENGEVTVEFPKSIKAQLQKASHISLIQTLPATIVIEQKQGIVSYTNAGAVIPLSVRSLTLLISVLNGKVTVSTDVKKSLVSVQVTSGTVQVAFTDATNASQVTTLSVGKSLIFNSQTKALVP